MFLPISKYVANVNIFSGNKVKSGDSDLILMFTTENVKTKSQLMMPFVIVFLEKVNLRVTWCN